MMWFVDQYLAGSDGALDDPRVSPLYASAEALAKKDRYKEAVEIFNRIDAEIKAF